LDAEAPELSLVTRPRPRAGLLPRLVVFAVWLGLVVFMAANHAFWRDEVRAFSLATEPDSFPAMLRAIHGEGHPAIWYLLLRAANDLVGSPVVLGILAAAVGAASALILLFLSPFPLWLATLFLASGALLFEYAVMARNYGISVPLMFLFAYFYPRHRQRGVLLGVLLALLCNTNAHSVLLAGAFMLFWILDMLAEQGLRWTPALRTLLLNGVIVAIGAALCAATVYPPTQDAAVVDPASLTLRRLLTAAIFPGSSFVQTTLRYPSLALGLPPISSYPASTGRKLASVLLFGSTLALIRLPTAFFVAVLSLIGLSLFFVVVYMGGYRHEALWWVFLISLYWIAVARGRTAWPARSAFPPIRVLAGIGFACFLGLAALQVPFGVASVWRERPGGTPMSRVRDLAALIRSRPDLKDAIVVSDQDHMLEALPYYVPNRTYFIRENRFGTATRFTRKARLTIDLDDILQTARDLHRQYRAPVVIAMTAPLDPAAPEQTLEEGITFNLHTTQAQVRDFLAATDFLGRLAPAFWDETFDVYKLKDERP